MRKLTDQSAGRDVNQADIIDAEFEDVIEDAAKELTIGQRWHRLKTWEKALLVVLLLWIFVSFIAPLLLTMSGGAG